MTVRTFQFPQGLSPEEKIAYSVSVIERYQSELTPLRKQLSSRMYQYDQWQDKAQEWREQYTKSQQELEEARKEIERLKQEIEKLTKTNERHRVSLFDHGNFKHPDEKDKKKKGGQTGHSNTNREQHEDYSSYQKRRIFATHCGNCGTTLSRVDATVEKIFLDIVVSAPLIKLILESERQWCGTCRKQVHAKHPQSLPFTEYGLNVFMMVLLLRFRCHLSFGSIATVLSIGFGLSISRGGVENILDAAKRYLQGRYDELVKIVQAGELMYNDETGWLIHGQGAYMWLMGNEQVTVYHAGEGRGHGEFKQMYGNSDAYSMHDGYTAYGKVTGKDKEVFCWGHVIRYAFEETVTSAADAVAIRIREELVSIYQWVRGYPLKERRLIECQLRKRLDLLLAITSVEKAAKNIHHRIQTQKEGLIRALLLTEDGTNNLSERGMRSIALSRNVSYGSDSYEGMQTTAVCASIVETMKQQKQLFFPTLTDYFKTGIQEKHPHYRHPVCFDDS